jgi:hypothetical protein
MGWLRTLNQLTPQPLPPPRRSTTTTAHNTLTHSLTTVADTLLVSAACRHASPPPPSVDLRIACPQIPTPSPHSQFSQPKGRCFELALAGHVLPRERSRRRRRNRRRQRNRRRRRRRRRWSGAAGVGCDHGATTAIRPPTTSLHPPAHAEGRRTRWAGGRASLCVPPAAPRRAPECDPGLGDRQPAGRRVCGIL